MDSSIVEKLWKSLRINLCEGGGKRFILLWIKDFFGYIGGLVEVLHMRVEKFFNSFAPTLTDVFWGFYTFSTASTNTTIILYKERKG